MNVSIVSERKYNKWASWHVVYEYEDIFSKYIKLKIHKNIFFILFKKIKNTIFYHSPILIKKIFEKKKFSFDGKECNLCFVMNANDYPLYCKKNYIPIFLDFSVECIEKISEATKNIPFFWVTSFDIYKKFIEKGVSNIYYIPLSVSDKYYKEEIPNKYIDVIQLGRKNSVLHTYMLKYCEKNKDVEYVYQSNGKQLTYYSTVKGNIGSLNTRDEYMNLLSSCRVSLVSTPGKDSSRDFGNIDFVTPRFYESAANYCYMLGRYSENEETDRLNISGICKNIVDYEQFERELDNYLKASSFLKKQEYYSFLQKNITSVRVAEVLSILESFSKRGN